MTPEEYRKQQLRQQIAALTAELEQLEAATAAPKSPPIPQPTPPLYQPYPPYQAYPPYPNPPITATPQPPAKRKDLERNFGKNVLGIFASALIFIGIVLLAYASGSALGQLLGIFAAGAFLTGAALFGARKKASPYRSFFQIVAGCGTGILYLGMFLAYWYYQLIPALVLYVLLLAWVGLMYLLSRYQSILFHLIGQVGTLVSTAYLFPRGLRTTLLWYNPMGTLKRTLLLWGFLLIAMVFYLLTNCKHTQKQRLISFYLNNICGLLLTAQLHTLSRSLARIEVDPYWRVPCICGGLTICVLAFQYFWEMRHSQGETGTSHKDWLMHYLPTVAVLFSCFLWWCGFFPTTYLQASQIVAGAVLLGFWIAAQHKHRYAPPYLVAFLLSLAMTLTFLFQCQPPVRFFGWCGLLLLLGGYGAYRHLPCYGKVTYGLFLFGTWALLPALFTGVPQTTLLFYSYLFFTLCNLLLLFYVNYLKQDGKRYLLLQLGNFVGMLSWLPFSSELTPFQKALLSAVLVGLYLVNSVKGLRSVPGQTTWGQVLFSLKYVLLVWLLCDLWQLQSFWFILGWSLLALGYTLGGFHWNKAGIWKSGWIMQLISTLQLLPWHNNWNSRLVCACAGFGVLYSFYRYGKSLVGKVWQWNKRYLALSSGALLLAGLQKFYQAQLLPKGILWVLLPLLGVALLAVGHLGQRPFSYYRGFYTALTGTGLWVLLLSILLPIPKTLTLQTLLFYVPLLLWVLVGCFLGKKQPSVFLPLCAGGILVAAFVLAQYPAIAVPFGARIVDTNLMCNLWNVLAVTAFGGIALGLVAWFTHRGNTRDSILLLIAQLLLSLRLMHSGVFQAVSRTVSMISHSQLQGGLALQQVLLLASVIFQYTVLMHHFRRERRANDKIWLLHLLPTLFQIGLLCLSWTILADPIAYLTEDTDGLWHFWKCLPYYGSAATILGFWLFAQRMRMPTRKYRTLGLCCILTAAGFLLTAPDEPALVRLAFWLVLLAVLVGTSLARHLVQYSQVAYGLLLFGSWYLLLPLLDALSTRQAFGWLVIGFTGLSCLVTLICRRVGYEKLEPISCVFHWCSMAVGSALLVSNLNISFLQDIFYLPLVEKILLALAVTAAFSMGTKSLPQKGRQPIREVLFGLKYTVLVWVLLCGFEAPGVLLSICWLLLAMGDILFGFFTSRRTIRIFGLCLLLLSICKLILVDIAYDRLFLRAVGLLLCGMLCFAISFLYHRLEQRENISLPIKS